MPEHHDHRLSGCRQLVQFLIPDALPAGVAVHQANIGCDPPGDPVQHRFAVGDLLAQAHGASFGSDRNRHTRQAPLCNVFPGSLFALAR